MLDSKEKRAVLLGAALGAVAGAGLALLFQRRRLPSLRGERKPIRAGQVVRLGSAIALVVRQLMEMLA
jgi:hypothetical protein